MAPSRCPSTRRRLAPLILLSLPSCSPALRGAVRLHDLGQAGRAAGGSLLGALEARARESEERTRARFVAAFPELHAEAQLSCPYGDEEKARAGGEVSFQCNQASEDLGATCPEVQTQRMMVAHKFAAESQAAFVRGASGTKLGVLFDKSEILVGDESYEEMVHYQIDGLMREEVVKVEDKILLKALAASVGVPATEKFYGAHASDWDPASFAKALEGLCARKVDGFIVKATHLAWSAGQKVVRGWQSVCGDAERLREALGDLTKFVEAEAIGQKPRETDGHLRFLEPGVTVEELFRTGGKSTIPLEAKVMVIWGKVYAVLLRGTDHRGCRVNNYAWQIYGDKTGWDLSGVISPSGGGDELNERFLREAWGPMVEYAESFAKKVEADFMRVDFFIGVEEDRMVVKLNECESVSGLLSWYDRQGFGQAWRDGYVVSGKWKMTPEKFRMLAAKNQGDRDAQNLDTH